jgi:hypothetical protein
MGTGWSDTRFGCAGTSDVADIWDFSGQGSIGECFIYAISAGPEATTGRIMGATHCPADGTCVA